MKKVISLLLVLVLGGIAARYFYSQQKPDAHPLILAPAPEEIPEPAVTASYPVPLPAATEEVPLQPLPSLANSDQSFIEALSELVGAETLGGNLVLEQVINRIVATIDSLDSRQVAPLVLPVQPLSGTYQVLEKDEGLVSNPQNTGRYEPLMQIVAAVETEQLMSVYRRFYPLFQESYESLGHGDAYFNDRLVGVIEHLLETPQLTGDPMLVKVEAQYQYADPELEGLSAGQRMILRSGPSNTATILEKLRSLKAALVQ